MKNDHIWECWTCKRLFHFDSMPYRPFCEWHCSACKSQSQEKEKAPMYISFTKDDYNPAPERLRVKDVQPGQFFEMRDNTYWRVPWPRLGIAGTVSICEVQMNNLAEPNRSYGVNMNTPETVDENTIITGVYRSCCIEATNFQDRK